MDLATPLFAKVILPTWERGLHHRATLTRLDWLERTQWRSYDELAAIQEGVLQERGRRDVAGEADAASWRLAVDMRARGWAGARVGGPVALYGELRGATPASRLDRFATRVRVVRDGDARAAGVAAASASTIVCDVRAATALAEIVARSGTRPRASVLVTSSDGAWLSADARRALGSAFGADPFEAYAIDGRIVASECDARDGLHVAVEAFVTDVSTGEIVVTALRDPASAVVRQRTGIRASLVTDRCSCGRGLPRLVPSR